MYYIKIEVAMRVDDEINADELHWVREALDGHLEGEEEIVYIKHLEKYNEGP